MSRLRGIHLHDVIGDQDRLCSASASPVIGSRGRAVLKCIQLLGNFGSQQLEIYWLCKKACRAGPQSSSRR
jgi:hypothetical protein